MLAGFSLPFLYANNQSDNIINITSDSTVILQNKLDSVDQKIKRVNNLTNNTLENNNKIFQNTKEELLRVVVCIDGYSCKKINKDSNNITCAIINDTIGK